MASLHLLLQDVTSSSPPFEQVFVPGMSFASMRVSGRKLLICYELCVWNSQMCALVSSFKLWQC